MRDLPLVLLLSLTTVACNVSVKILSFGGNGMIGSEVLSRLFARDDGTDYEVTLVSRGNWPFDSAERIMPNLKRAVVCDRAKDAECAGLEDCDINTLHYCKELMEVVNATERFDYVLDFSGYEAKWVHDAIHTLKGKVGYYVFISTDSVYEVCDAKEATDRVKSKEEDAVRPTDNDKRDELRHGDPYGDAKLGSEEALNDQRNDEGGFPWVALRFSDVIGPRDNTFRWIVYHLWIKFYHDLQLPLHVPQGMENVTASFTYVDDAASSIILAMDGKEKVWDQAYNIAMEEEFTLPKTLAKIADMLEVNGTETSPNSIEESFFIYPTVFKGPVDISKAKDELGFVPTSADTAFRETVRWYEEAFTSREKEREDMLKRFQDFVIPRNKRDHLLAAVGRSLQKKGIVKKKYRSLRKGDLEDLEHEEL
jgi:nucleoside-diphosphate-sugar epimerase